MNVETIRPQLDWINLTPEDGHFHFGYYDRCPFDTTGRLHLALRIPQQERLPEPGETATVGYIDVENTGVHTSSRNGDVEPSGLGIDEPAAASSRHFLLC